MISEVATRKDTPKMKIVFGADHGGFELKETLKKHCLDSGYQIEDLGTHSTDSCDYPLIADKVAAALANGAADFGILVCGTGIGISIAANRHKGIRAALLYNDAVAALAREHNDANIAVFGARTQNHNDAIRFLDIFLKTPFSNGERHCRRIAELG